MIIMKVGHSTNFNFTYEIDLQVDDVWPRGCFSDASHWVGSSSRLPT
jgi:hypothetical protein